MRAKIRPILEECIEKGVEYGYLKAHKHHPDPPDNHIFSEIENAIWLEIDQRFDFERNVCDEVVEGFDQLEKEDERCGVRVSYTYPAQDINIPKGWRRVTSGKVSFLEEFPEREDFAPKEREWVGLSDKQAIEIRSCCHMFEDPLVYCMEAVESALKAKNT